MRYELFNRLNTGGSPLTDQEIRNCIFRGISSDFNNFLKTIAQNPDFVELIAPTEKQVSELYLEELVLRFVSLYKNYHNVKQVLSVHMTEYMRNVIKDGSFDYSRGELLLRVINLLKPFGKDIFRKGGGFSTGLYEAITIGVAVNIDYYTHEGAKEVKRRIGLLKTEHDFSQFTGSASNSKSRIINRMKIAERIFGNR
jgi:hypothetical protein